MDFAESKSPPWHSAVTLMWRSHPWLTLGTVLTGLLSGVASIVGVGLISRALHDPDARRTLLLVFIAVNVVAIVCRSGAAVMPSYACMKLMTRLRVNLCKRILATPLDEIDRRGAPNVLTLLTQDIPQLSQTLLTIPTIIVQSVVLICSIVYLAYLSWIVFASTMVLTIVGLALYLFFYRRAVNFTERVRDEFVRFNEYTHGLVFGIKELKLNRARRRWFTRAAIELSSKRVAGFNYIERFWFMGGDTIGQITVAVLLGFLLFGVPSLGVVDPSVLTASILAVLYMMGPLTMLINILPMVAEGKTALARLAEFGFLVDDTQVSPADRSPARAPESSSAGAWRVIELKGVKMNYRDSESTTDFVLGPIDMTIHAGELVYVIGGNGSGKSTLGKVLSGLYAPTEGHIALDGAVVDDDARERYRNLFSAVFTDFHLFDRVIGPDREDEGIARARRYLETLKLADKIRIDGKHYSTTTALSTGQRKRLALLCAYIEDRPIYILDEWAADQDPVFKRFFYEVLVPDLRARGKCVVIITHDDQYFGLADRVIRLERGRIFSDTAMETARAEAAG
ncbi:cyclic peptide export ABC transporter [Burkholderia vietnamiensis]|uniref:cyclic peptide export ABC transporter n=1 Tax=Burkholderia vietnamiensis TaxID=60552 RepID=UPI0008414E64|nr:cyclic peptide export ABC transporter [Burkholderia vietnamiensis]AOK02077.1 ATP-binding protein [Burkholderia vietnamiensis]AOK44557.1 ATP-binding protein [Burkholderia vietnamiensis]MBR8162938.1 cyclic peptide export ABC transporter [Burkholderia vietnamiensis]MCA8148968.1 cyclic peptide export ABC transporter [Burkholderia vietnamiensis]HDR8949201.1 cyclic peptide export ABC transporter [Burkholderia vietnamiensis]